MEADEIIERLGLEPHPEGGWYRRTWAGEPDASGRPRGSAICYLLRAGEVSHWHRLDAVELWHHYAGDAIELSISVDGRAVETTRLGVDLAAGEVPQVVVPKGAWQSARSLGRCSLVGCTVTPGFVFEGFELAPPVWSPGR